MPDDQTVTSQSSLDTTLREVVPPVLMALGAFSLFRTSRLLSLAVLGAWAYDFAAHSDHDRRRRGRDVGSKRDASATIDTAMEDSFPASDPPSFSGTTAGAP
jgi:hypothetical protein